ncbi:2-amino-4-oxopentanoate thiolase subunit OrtA [Alkaliphilus hydrothermalis]|uniref:2-amino-4-ketopentanoate thiolase n=1 Tax=Alkaliphilus hydrothermalis TaxID=1482730 RepID=A0ABS2NM12_9FIRM|nr:2-amino-4-oxopentanoate thiolase subunit OrtA [Alkaliphilus hydrothermalis]MBM7613911.1 hypothetical protein [Alkaliphilus hydrothermalis]
MQIEKGSWVRIHDIVLSPQDRSPNLPEDTKKVPLEMWVKGFLLEDGNIGERVEIETITGRRVAGTLLEANPHYDHDFGKFVPEILEIGLQLKKVLWAGENHD